MFRIYFANCSETGTYAYEEPGIGRNLIYMFVTGIVCFIILLIFEYRVFEGIAYAIAGMWQGKPKKAQEDDYDDDVFAEKERVQEMTKDDLQANNLVLKDLSKYYGNFLAVNQLSIAVQRCVLKQNIFGKIKIIKIFN